MPSPIAHLSVGYAIYRYYKKRLPEAQIQVWKLPLQLMVIAGLSLLPDLDVIPAIFFKDMHRFHNNLSHSVFVAIPVSFLVASVFHHTYRSNFWLWFLICLVSYDLHIIMDALNVERGVMALWPLTQNRYASPIKVFCGLRWGLGWFSLRHLWTAFTESLFVLVIMIAVKYFDKRRSTANRIIT
jgi:LexA-binding, inner membrane-associated putative hydrolase